MKHFGFGACLLAAVQSIFALSTDLNLKNNIRPCALLFFGIPRKFSDLVFSSMDINVLEKNKDCAIFVHSYKTSTDFEANNSGEINLEELNPLLERTSASKFDTEDDFQKQYNVEYYRKFFPKEAHGWSYPKSMDNMIRQWHSIKSVWDLMTEHEEANLQKFQNVGFFRLDVEYKEPVMISSNEFSVVPSLMHKTKFFLSQINDRMFYGVREFAEIWATERFPSVEEYLTWQENIDHPRIKGLHSESFLNYLLIEKWKLPIQERDICFHRVRTSGEILQDDCELIGKKKATGAVVLGMHRSGTSLLTGLLVKSSVLTFPDEDIKTNEENPLGFFENKNVVGLNDIWLSEQGLSWNRPFEVDLFDNTVGIETFNDEIPCLSNCTQNVTIMSYFNRAIAAHSKGFSPWVLKDPRLCITLPTWLQAFESAMVATPAIVMIYRNPLEVAKSLNKRKHGKTVNIWEGLMLWIWYNKMAIINSNGLCRSVTNMEVLIADPIREIRRIRDELGKCNIFMDKVPKLNQTGIEVFTDKQLNHQYSYKGSNIFESKSQDCTFPKYISKAEDLDEKELEQVLYRRAMKLYCDMQSGIAFERNYVWSSLEDILLQIHEVTSVMGSSEVNSMTSQKRNLRKESGKGNKSTKEKVKENDQNHQSREESRSKTEVQDERSLVELSSLVLELDWFYCGGVECSPAELCIEEACVCPPGMSNDGYRGCIDTNECETNYPCPGRVGIESYCVDHDPPEMFTCGCHTGFESVYAPWDDTLLIECAASGAVAVEVQSFAISGVSPDTDLDDLTAKITQDIIDSFSAGTKRSRRLQSVNCGERVVLQSLNVVINFEICSSVCLVITISIVTAIQFTCDGEVVDDINKIKDLLQSSELEDILVIPAASAEDDITLRLYSRFLLTIIMNAVAWLRELNPGIGEIEIEVITAPPTVVPTMTPT